MFTVSIHINTSKYKLVLVFVPVSMSVIVPLLVLASVLMLGLISVNTYQLHSFLHLWRLIYKTRGRSLQFEHLSETAVKSFVVTILKYIELPANKGNITANFHILPKPQRTGDQLPVRAKWVTH